MEGEAKLKTQNEKKALAENNFITLVSRFEHICSLHPDEVAITFKHKKLTYRSLNAKANRVANTLLAKGIKEEDKIPILLDRSEKMIISILGILKAGAAFVPLSKEYPKERIQYIVSKVAAPLVIDDLFWTEKLSNLETNPVVEITSHSLAYIIFTSGTTGKPKGVMIEHQSIINSVKAHAKVLNIQNGGKKYLQYANFVFDASVIEIFPTLLYGNELVITPSELRLDIYKLSEYIKNNRIHCAIIPPAMLDTDTLLPLDFLMVAGEASNTEILDKYTRNNVHIINGYGPTELAVSVSLHEYRLGDTATNIGKPQDGVEFYSLNSAGQLVKTGEIGELVVSGVQVARGYIGESILTEEKFIKNDFCKGKAYRTGDLVKMNQDGTYEFMGRNDFQVKVRGYRIELNEVEARIQELREVKKVICNTYKNSLIAYYVSDTPLSVFYLKNELKNKLPNYMIPDFFKHLNQLPMTINGKVDKRQLPLPKDLDETIEYSVTDTQSLVKSVIEETLGLNNLSPETNLFEVGMNSLSAMKAAKKLKLPSDTLFEEKTIKNIAAVKEKGDDCFKILPRTKKTEEMSYAQERLWFLNCLNTETSAYNIPIIITLCAKIDIEKLISAFSVVVNRHDVLRTMFIDDKPVISNKNIEVTQVPINNRTFFMKPFNLIEEIPIRVNIHLNKLMICIHHIAFDGWSLDIFINELLNAYNNHCMHTMEIQYSDFAVWQKKFINSGILDRQLPYWRKHLTDYEELNLPHDFDRPEYFSGKGDTVTIRLEQEVMKKIENSAKNNATTPFTVLISAYFITLASFSNQSDIVVGSPFSNRHYADTDNLIGFFVNTLPVRSVIDWNDTVADYLAKINGVLLNHSKNQDIPFEKIVEDQKIDSGIFSSNPIFQTTFAIQNFGKVNDDSESIFTSIDTSYELPVSSFDLSVTLDQSSLCFNYSTDVFKEETINAISETYLEILKQIIDQKELQLSKLSYKSNAIPLINQDIPFDSLLEMFDLQVKSKPQEIAVISGEKQLTYEQLDQKANQVAHLLDQNYNIGIGDIIPILVGKSEKAIIAILGIMKTGAAFCALDLTFPQQRIDSICQLIKAKLIVTEKTIDEADLFSFRFLRQSINSENLAYLIFTSGTTGNPKGVMVNQKAIVNTIYSQAKTFGISEGDNTYLQYANYIFDASVMEIFSALCFGNRLVILPEKARLSLELIAEFILKEKINIAILPPVILNTDILLPLDTLIVGGDKTRQPVIDFYLKAGIKVFNAYGPTEASVSTTLYEYADGDSAAMIGTPQLNTSVFVLDEFLRMVPKGGIGELYIGGPQLATGYYQNKIQTQERFIKSNYGRIYRTGDIVRYMPSKELKYVGRNDFQIKIRGNRVEIEAIESKLLQFDGIKAAVVIFKDELLVAYYVADSYLNKNKIREHLSQKLPSYMLPHYYEQLDQLPLTNSGKVDRNMLPKIKKERANPVFRTPKNQLEVKIREAFAIALHSEQKEISTDDNFFHIGGDSIKAISVSSLLKKNNIHLSVRQIMETPTISCLSEKVKNGQDCPKIETMIQDGIVNQLPIQEWFFDRELKMPNHFNQAYILQTNTNYSNELLLEAFNQLVYHHDALRTQMKYAKKELKQGTVDEIDQSENIFVETITLNTALLNEESISKIASECQEQLDLEAGRAIIVKQLLSENNNYLIVTIHHLMIDEVSWLILLEDLFYLLDRPRTEWLLPTKSTSAYGWAAYLKNEVKKGLFDYEIPYWQQVLQKQEEEVIPKVNNQDLIYKNSKNIDFCLSRSISEKLITKANQAFNTKVLDLLLTALCAAVNETYFKQKISVLLEGHGRNFLADNLSLDRTVGWFTSLYPIKLDSSLKGMKEQIITTKEALREIPSDGQHFLSLIKHRDELKIDSKNWQETAEISFNYLGDISAKKTESYRIVPKTISNTIGKLNKKLAKIEINCFVLDGLFKTEVNYSTAIEESKAIEFLSAYKKSLQDIVMTCLAMEGEIKTKSDYKCKGLTNEDYHAIVGEFHNVDAIQKLTQMQLGIFYDYLKKPESNNYSEQITFELKGDISTEKIMTTFQLIQKNNQQLRTRFRYEGLTDVYQVVVPNCIGEVNIIEEEDENEIWRYLEEEANRSFDLLKDSLIRLHCIVKDSNTKILAFSYHHILMDGWGTNQLVERFFSILAGEKLENNFVDYTDYLESYFKGDKQGAINYWKNYLSGFKEGTIVPSFNLGEKSQEDKMRRKKFKLTKESFQSVNSAKKRLGVNLSDIFTSVWGIVLQKIKATDDVVFGSIISGRENEEVDLTRIIGLCIEQIPIRIVNKNNRFDEVVYTVNKDIINIPKNSNLSISEIMGLVGCSTPQHKIIVDNYPQTFNYLKTEDQNISLEMRRSYEKVEYDFGINFIFENEKIAVEFNYNLKKYSNEDIDKLYEIFNLVLKTVVSKPQIELSKISIVSDTENELLEIFSGEPISTDVSTTFLERFEGLVKSQPDCTALNGKDSFWTYNELNVFANSIAYSLEYNNVKKDDKVALLCKNAELMLPAILAVMKIGAVFVPLDSNAPIKRNNWIIKESGCQAVLSDYNEPKINHLPVIDVSSVNIEEYERISTYDPESLAYIIYTSGTSGKPKGVQIKNESLSNYIDGLIEKVGKQGLRSSIVLSQLNFDLSFTALFVPLSFGGEVTVLDKEDYIDSETIVYYIMKNSVTYLKVTPSLFSTFEFECFSKCCSLQLIILGGELPDTKAILNFLKCNPQVEFLNHYGPTETTIGCLLDYINIEELEEKPSYNCIGRPLKNNKVYILDKNHQQLPLGMTGEIFISGKGVASGYLNNSILTEEKFTENPFLPGAEMYATGDVGRFNQAGLVEFLGRKDFQIKHLGYRVELTEIEETFKRFEPVINAAVVQIERDKLAVALVLKCNEELEAVKKLGDNELPEYMRPSVYKLFDKLPLTANGKKDYKSITKLFSKKKCLPYETDNVLPEKEQKIINIIREVMSDPAIKLEDNFYDVGGNSILAIRMLAKVKSELDKKVTLKDLISSETFKKFSQMIISSHDNEQLQVEEKEESKDYIASSQQKRILALSMREPGNTAYNIPIILKVPVNIDENKFYSAVDQVIKNNEVLRTIYYVKNGDIYQKVLSDFNIQNETITVEFFHSSSQLNQYIHSFDLMKEIPIRYKLFKSASLETIILFDVHHIAMDGESINLFLDQVFRSYNNDPLSRPAFQYKEYTKYQVKSLRMTRQNLKDYWSKRFSEVHPKQIFWKSRGQDTEEKETDNLFAGEIDKFLIDSQLNERITNFCVKNRLTKYNLLLSGFILALSQISGQDELVINGNYSGRDRDEFNQTMGMFVNTLPHIFKVNPKEKTTSYLESTKQILLDDIEHGDLPYEEIIKLVKDKQVSITDIFSEIAFVYEKEGNLSPFIGKQIEIIEPEYNEAKFMLSLLVSDGQKGLNCTIEFRKNGVSKENVEKLRTAYVSTLEALINEKHELKIEDIEVNMKEQEDKLIVCSRGPRNELFVETSILTDFEKIVSSYPNRLCLVENGNNFTFSEINKKANGLAQKIRASNLVQQIVPIILPRGKELIISILALWKAGKAYLPIDPEYPKKRIKQILDENNGQLILSDQYYTAKLSEYTSKIFQVQYDSIEASEDIQKTHEMDLPAYVIYTSGTTGKPKGIIIGHKALANYIHWSQQTYMKTNNDVIALFSSISFDLTVTSLFTCLSSGGTTKIFNDDDPLALIQKVLQDEMVNIVKLTPAHLKIAQKIKKLSQSIHTFIIGGENLLHDLADSVYERINNVRIFNEYGPTEATVGCMVYEFDPNIKTLSVPIGKPIANTKVYILGKNMTNIKAGEIGELFISGYGLAKGYLNDPISNEQKFIKNDGNILYRTGDLCCCPTSGVIEFFGRMDEQIKINGYRIEIEEIQNTLKKMDAVKDAVVLKETSLSGTQTLTSYLVLEEGIRFSAEYFRDGLAKILPHYMIPNKFFPISAIPLTINGKIDKNKLYEVTDKLRNIKETQEEFNSNQVELIETISANLKIESVTLADNYYELGGDSIQAIIISSEMKDKGYNLQVSDILKHPQLEKMLDFVKPIQQTQEFTSLKENTGYSLTPIQRWFFAQNFQVPNHYNQSLLLNLKKDISYESVTATMEKILAKHSVLRTKFIKEQKTIKQCVSKTADSEISEYLQLNTLRIDKDKKEQIEEISSQAAAAIDIFTGPLWQCRFIKSKNSSQLLFVFHHLIMDVVSWSILLNDFEKGLNNILGKEDTPYAIWAEAFENTTLFENEADFWKNQEAEPLFELKSIEEKLPQFIKYDLKMEVDRDSLEKMNKQLNLTTFDLIITCIVYTLSKVTKKEKVPILMESHGRSTLSPDLDINNCIGWFTTFYPLVFDCELGQSGLERLRTIQDLMRRVKNMGIGYFANFDQQKNSLPQVKFNYIGDVSDRLSSDLFELDETYVGSDIPVGNKSSIPLEINCRLIKNKIIFEIQQSRILDPIFDKEIFKLVLEQELEALRTLNTSFSSEQKLEVVKDEQKLFYQKINALLKKYPNIQAMHSLMPTQEGLFYEWVKDPTSSNYVEQTVIELKGEIEREKFVNTVNTFAEKLEILRSTFVYSEEASQPVQIISSKSSVEISYRRVLTKDIDKIIESDQEEPFDLSKGPLVRLTYIFCLDGLDRIIFTFHHILLDGWSKTLLIEQFAEAISSEKVCLSKDQSCFCDYADYINSRKTAHDIVWWQNYLRDYDSKITFPVIEDLNRQEPAVEQIDFSFDNQILEKLKNIARDNKTTLSIIINVIWGLLLQRYANSKDIVFGTVVSGRNRNFERVSNGIGMFANTIPVRINTKNCQTIDRLIDQVKQDTLEMMDVDFYSLADIVSNTSINNKTINQLVVFDNLEHEKEATPADYKILKTSSKTEFALEVFFGVATVLQIRLRYHSSILTKHTIQSFIASFTTIVEQISENDKMLLSEIALLNEEEQLQLLALTSHLTNGNTNYPVNVPSLMAILSENFVQYANKVAVIYQGEKYSYEYLNQRSNQIANLLKKHKVKPSDVIGLYFDKSVELLIAMIGIMKVGAVMLPIDIELPKKRVHYMVKNSECDVILSSKMNHENYFKGVKVIQLKEYTGLDCSAVTEWKKVNGSDLQYILYTSGSTGRPKGVEVSIAALANFITYSQKAVEIEQDINMISITSCSFDIFISETFLPLIKGGKLTILNNEESKDPACVLETINQYECNAIQTTPSRVKVLLEEMKTGLELSSIRMVYLMGEVLKESLIRQLEKIKPLAIYNCYGPTEGTIWVTAKKVQLNQKITIGRPIQNVELYILNDDNQLAPLGSYGQLVISGNSLANGYRNNPDQNEAVFITLGGVINRRVYLTGDLARWSSNGEIEVAGRIDNQIKINGVRIELKEIEEVAKKFIGVKDAVIVTEKNQNSKEIHLYISLYDDEAILDTKRYRHYLSSNLISQMMPKVIKQVRKLPLNLNGKIDNERLRKLPVLNGNQTVKKTVYQNSNEEKMSKLWSDILGIKITSTTDTFFDIGGNSLKVIELVNLINETFNVDLSVSDFFNNPTISLLTKKLEYGVSKENTELQNTCYNQRLILPDTFRKLDKSKFRITVISAFCLLISTVEHSTELVIQEYRDNQRTKRLVSLAGIEESDQLLEKINQAFSNTFLTENYSKDTSKETKWILSEGTVEIEKKEKGIFIDSGKREVIFLLGKMAGSSKELNQLSNMLETILKKNR